MNVIGRLFMLKLKYGKMLCLFSIDMKIYYNYRCCIWFLVYNFYNFKFWIEYFFVLWIKMFRDVVRFRLWFWESLYFWEFVVEFFWVVFFSVGFVYVGGFGELIGLIRG